MPVKWMKWRNEWVQFCRKRLSFPFFVYVSDFSPLHKMLPLFGWLLKNCWIDYLTWENFVRKTRPGQRLFKVFKLWKIGVYIHVCLMKWGKHESRIVKAHYGCANLNIWIPDSSSAWYSTLNKGRFPSYFWITTPGWVICQSLKVLL